VRAFLADRPRRRRAVHAWHDQVHQHHVRLDAGAQKQGFLSAPGFAHQLQIVKGQQERGQPAAYYGVIVHQHHANRFG
jgi:hypothetical protein